MLPAWFNVLNAALALAPTSTLLPQNHTGLPSAAGLCLGEGWRGEQWMGHCPGESPAKAECSAGGVSQGLKGLKSPLLQHYKNQHGTN